MAGAGGRGGGDGSLERVSKAKNHGGSRARPSEETHCQPATQINAALNPIVARKMCECFSPQWVFAGPNVLAPFFSHGLKRAKKVATVGQAGRSCFALLREGLRVLFVSCWVSASCNVLVPFSPSGRKKDSDRCSGCRGENMLSSA